jgi:hypothetical protein
MPDARDTDDQGRALNKDGSVSKVQPTPRFVREVVHRTPAEAENIRRRAANEFIEMELVRAGVLAVYKSPGRFTCSFCQFRELCELHESGADWEEFRRLLFQSWEPYSAHEVEKGEKV